MPTPVAPPITAPNAFAHQGPGTLPPRAMPAINLLPIPFVPYLYESPKASIRAGPALYPFNIPTVPATISPPTSTIG